MIKAKSRLDMKFDWSQIDLSDVLAESGKIVAQEIRGSVKRGESAVEGVSLQINAPSTIKQKVRLSGESKPLVAKHKTLISTSSYKIESDAKSAKITLSDMQHPSGNASIADIGAWNHNGTNKIPSRPFFGITDTAKKRIIAMVARNIKEVLRG